MRARFGPVPARRPGRSVRAPPPGTPAAPPRARPALPRPCGGRSRAGGRGGRPPSRARPRAGRRRGPRGRHGWPAPRGRDSGPGVPRPGRPCHGRSRCRGGPGSPRTSRARSRDRGSRAGSRRAKRASQRSSASTIGTASRTTSARTACGRSIAVRKATYAPRSWPTTANRAWPSARMSATHSRAIARLEYGSWSGVVGGLDDSPWPRRSGHTTVCAAASSGATRSQVAWVRGCPCSSRSGGLEPPCRTPQDGLADVHGARARSPRTSTRHRAHARRGRNRRRGPALVSPG